MTVHVFQVRRARAVDADELMKSAAAHAENGLFAMQTSRGRMLNALMNQGAIEAIGAPGAIQGAYLHADLPIPGTPNDWQLEELFLLRQPAPETPTRPDPSASPAVQRRIGYLW